jgi:hypothetical protein
MAAYQLIYNSPNVTRESDGGIIAQSLYSVDWMNYQNWLIEGNTPDPAAILPNPSVISVPAFWARFTSGEQAAIEAAAASTPAILTGLTFGLVVGQVNLLTGPIVSSWMASLVTAGVITSARSATILTP